MDQGADFSAAGVAAAAVVAAIGILVYPEVGVAPFAEYSYEALHALIIGFFHGRYLACGI